MITGRLGNELVSWSRETMLEVELPTSDNFLKVKETLSRIGIASRQEKVLYQSCHILHKQGRYYIVHFKELFALDGKPTNISQEDLERRNTIASLLQDWGLVKLVGEVEVNKKQALSQIKIVPHKEKRDWVLKEKYTIGGRRV